MHTKNISFIIPAFNCQDTIAETVDSIFNNNFVAGDEIIIVDDASTDNTIQRVRELKNKYQFITILNHNVNKGSAAAGRNTGIDIARNNLIFCLDADNMLLPNSIGKLKEYMFACQADVAAFGQIFYFKESIEQVTHSWQFSEEIDLIRALNETDKSPISSGNYLFTKDSWKKAGRYNESIGGAYDSWAFGLYQLFTGSKMVTLKDTFYYHRYGYDSAFIREEKKRNTSLLIMQILVPFFHLIEEEDVDYILSPKYRNKWFDLTRQRPLRIKTDNKRKSLFTRIWEHI